MHLARAFLAWCQRCFTFHILNILLCVVMPHGTYFVWTILSICAVNCCARIAICTHGPASVLTEWLQMYISLIRQPDGVNIIDHAHLFALSEDKPLPESLCNSKGIMCGFSTAYDSIVSSRNALSRVVFDYETRTQGEFKYWLFADHDTLNVTCHAHSGGTIWHQSTNCLARFVHFLLARTSYAQVHANNLFFDELEVEHENCGGYRFHAIHRAAVPLLLPYVNLGSNYSISESQGILWRVAQSCIPNATISSGLLSVPNWGVGNASAFPSPGSSSVNTSFPANTSITSAIRTNTSTTARTANPIQLTAAVPALSAKIVGELMSAVYGRLAGAYPGLIRRVDSNTAVLKAKCLSNPLQHYAVSAALTLPSASWRVTDRYRKCLKALKPRFLSFMQYTGNGSWTE